MAKSIASLVHELRQEINRLNQELDQARTEREQTERLPVPRDEVIARADQRIDHLAAHHEKEVRQALSASQSPIVPDHLVFPELIGGGIPGTTSRADISPCLMAWLFADQLKAKARELAKNLPDGIDQATRKQRLAEIDATIRRLETDKQLARDQLSAAGLQVF